MILKENALFKLCEALDLQNQRGIYLLSGTLASGKTTLVRAFLKALGIKDNVTSPTYLTAVEYGNGVYHYDIYQKDLQELFALGFLEEIEKEGWHFIEWGDENLAKILREIGLSFTRINITMQDDAREYTILRD